MAKRGALPGFVGFGDDCSSSESESEDHGPRPWTLPGGETQWSQTGEDVDTLQNAPALLPRHTPATRNSSFGSGTAARPPLVRGMACSDPEDYVPLNRQEKLLLEEQYGSKDVVRAQLSQMSVMEPGTIVLQPPVPGMKADAVRALPRNVASTKQQAVADARRCLGAPSQTYEDVDEQLAQKRPVDRQNLDPYSQLQGRESSPAASNSASLYQSDSAS